MLMQSEERRLYTTNSMVSMGRRYSYFSESKVVLKNSIPVIASMILQYALGLMLIYFVKGLGEKKLAAVSLCNTLYYITGPALFNGFSTSLDTLCNQAFGAKKFHEVGYYCQQCIVLMALLLVPLTLFHFNCVKILLEPFFIKDEEIVNSCQYYLRVIVFGTPALIIFEVERRFLLCQGIFHPPTFILLLLVPINMIWCSYSIPKFAFSIVPWILVVNYWFMAISLSIYILWTKNPIYPRKCFIPIRNITRLTKNMGHMFHLSLNGVCMTISEAMAFQILTFMTCKLSINELAAQSIVITVADGIFQIPFGVSICCCTKLANVIGSGDLIYSKFLVRTYLFMSFILGSICLIATFFTKNLIAHILSPSGPLKSTIEDITSKTLIIVSVNQFGDCINIICSGILRAQGRQRVGSILNFVCFYVLALPIEFILGFRSKYGIYGLWSGLGLGIIILFSSEIISILRSNWNNVLERCSKINAKSQFDCPLI